jgi:hypothetical protein
MQPHTAVMHKVTFHLASQPSELLLQYRLIFGWLDELRNAPTAAERALELEHRYASR